MSARFFCLKLGERQLTFLHTRQRDAYKRCRAVCRLLPESNELRSESGEYGNRKRAIQFFSATTHIDRIKIAAIFRNSISNPDGDRDPAKQ